MKALSLNNVVWLKNLRTNRSWLKIPPPGLRGLNGLIFTYRSCSTKISLCKKTKFLDPRKFRSKLETKEML